MRKEDLLLRGIVFVTLMSIAVISVGVKTTKAGDAFTVCEFSGGYTYSVDSVPGNTYEWDVIGGDVTENHGQKIEVKWQSAENDSALVTILQTDTTNTNQCYRSSSHKITIEPRPVPKISGPQKVCEFSGNHSYAADSINGHIYNWSINGGSITQESGHEIEVAWDASGIGSITLIQTDTTTKNNCDSAITYEVTINPLPQVAVSGEAIVCEFAQNIPYQASYFDTTHTFNWTVDGGSITQNNDSLITVNWDAFGSGIVMLEVTTLEGCIDNDTFEVTISPLPQAVVSGDQQVCEFSEGVAYNATGYNNVNNYNWTVFGGSIAQDNDSVITVNWDTSGFGRVFLEVTSVEGCIEYDTLEVIITPLPQASFIGSQQVCEYSDGKTYKAAGYDPIYTYNWTVIGGSITESADSAITVNWGSAGAGKIHLAVTSGEGCIDGDTLEININQLPEATVSGEQFVCEFASGMDYVASGYDSANTYNWKVDGGSITDYNDSLVTVSWNSAGIGKVIVEVISIDGCIETDTIEVTIIPLPQAVVSGDQQVCELSEGVKYIADGYNNANNYNWTVTGGSIARNDDSVLTVNWNSAGTGAIFLEVTSGEGCIDSDTMNIDLEPEPNPEIQGTAVICEYSGGVVYSVDSVQGYIYNWTVNGGSIAEDLGHQIVVDWDQAGNGEIIVNVVDANTVFGCEGNDTLHVTIESIPNPVIQGSTGSIEFMGGFEYFIEESSQNDYSYDWNVTGGTITHTQHNRIIVQWGEQGTGYVTVIVTDMETSTNCTNTITFEVNIKENPAPEISGTENVCITSESDDIFYYDIIDTGEHMYTWQVEMGEITEEDTTTGSIGVKWLGEGNGKLIVGQTNPISGQTKYDTFHVNILNKPTVEIAGEFLICNPDRSYRYSVEDISFAKYYWDVEGGSIKGTDETNNINVEWDINAASYKISVVVSLSEACESRSEKNIELSQFALEGKPDLFSDSECLPFKPQLKNPADFSADNITWALNGEIINTGTNPRLTIDESAIYSLTAIIERDGNQCIDTFTYNVEGMPMPTAAVDFLNEPDALYDNHSIEFQNNSKDGHVYTWETSEGFRKETHDLSNVNIIFEMPGKHYLTLTAFNEFGCRDTTTMAINVEPEEWMYVPSAFSPNGDGLNDYFQVEHKLVVSFQITIVDRWGTILFTSNDPDFKWDGTIDGDKLDPGIYVYQIQARGWSGSIKHENGTITLMH